MSKIFKAKSERERERVNATRQILDFIKFYFKRSFKGAFILGKVKF